MKIPNWGRWGLCFALAVTILSAVLGQVARRWWIGNTIWYEGLVFLNYPAAIVSDSILHHLRIPRIHDAETPSEQLVILWVGASTTALWWFCMGAGLALLIGLRRPAKQADQ